MNDNQPRRIVTRSTSAQTVGPRISQWAYSIQPYATRGIHLQVRCDRGETMVEAVSAHTGDLLASAPQIVCLRTVMDPIVERMPVTKAA